MPTEAILSDETIIILCSVLALCILGVSIALAILSRRHLKRVVRILGVGVFLMLLTLIYPSYSIKREPFALGLALVQSMCALLLNANAGEILEGFDAYTLPFIGVYKAVLLALLIVAPLFTVGITLSFFSEKFALLIYRVRSAFNPSFIFSDINERTLCVAEDIARQNPKAVIIFAVREEKDKIKSEALDRIKKAGATIINEDLVAISHSLKHERNYYLLSADGNVNLDLGLRLYEKYNDAQTHNVNMWLYTKDEISEVIFDHLYENFNVRLINEENLIARQLVADYPLYNAVKDNKLSVLIVGGGNVGLEILRWTTACSCLGDNVDVEINVIDLNAVNTEAIFNKTSPNLAQKWNIKFHFADVKTVQFTALLNQINPTYIVIALGNENLNLETALYVRHFYGIANGLPHIHALVDHKRTEEQILSNLCVTFWTYTPGQKKHSSEFICSYEIRPFGCYEETYSNLRIGASYLDCLAVAHNATYCGITEINDFYTPALLTELYNQVMFFKDFSDSFAVSISYKLHLMGLQLCDDGEGNIDVLAGKIDENINLLRNHENMRYEAFMRSHGWTDMPIEEVRKTKITQDKLKKRNARIVNTHVEELTDIMGRNYLQEDENALRKLPIIIKLANELYGKSYSVIIKDK